MAGRQRLTARTVEALREPGKYCDGGGLWFRVTPTGTRNRTYRFMRYGKAREMGLGPYPEVTLAEARDMALDARRKLLKGLDPLDTRTAERNAARVAEVGGITFADAAEQYIKAHKASWKHPATRRTGRRASASTRRTWGRWTCA